MICFNCLPLASPWRTVTKFEVKDPLVIIMGIGEYHDKLQNLPGIGADYKNCVLAFNSVYNYSVFYKNHKNKNVYAKDKIDLSTAKLSRKVKIEWVYDEIIQFFKNARDIIVKNQHDALITIISSHGDMEGVIVDSNHEEVSLIEIFSLFNRNQCVYLQDKPKIMFIDACRGQMISKVNVAPIANINSKNSNNTATTTYASLKTKLKLLSLKSLNNIDVTNDNDNTDDKNDENKQNTVFKDNESNVSQKKENCNQNGIKSQLEKTYHKEGNYRFIYANIDGYAVVEGGTRGGYLIRAIRSVFGNVDHILSSNLDEIVHQINEQAKQRVGTSILVQQVEDVNRMDGIVTFQKKT